MKIVYVARYERHNREVLEYFKDPGRTTCSYLTCPAATAGTNYARSWGTKFPTEPFPRTPTRQAGHAKLKNWIKKS